MLGDLVSHLCDHQAKSILIWWVRNWQSPSVIDSVAAILTKISLSIHTVYLFWDCYIFIFGCSFNALEFGNNFHFDFNVPLGIIKSLYCWPRWRYIFFIKKLWLCLYNSDALYWQSLVWHMVVNLWTMLYIANRNREQFLLVKKCQLVFSMSVRNIKI